MTDDERDLAFSLAVLDVQAGPDGRPLGDVAAARRGFARVRAAAAPNTGLWWAALRGEMQAVDLAPDTDNIAAAAEAVLASHPNAEFARWALPKLVNAGRYDLARRVADASAPLEPPAGQPLTDQDRDVVFSLAVLGLQDGPPASPPGLAATRARFSRARGAAAPGSGLWWAAFRGELQAADQAGDAPGAAAVVAEVAAAHPKVDLGFPEMIRLVNAGRYGAAREVARRARLGTIGFAQPHSTLPLSGEERDRLFFLAVLDAEIGPDGRAAGEPAAGRSRFARVRAATPPGSDLWWAALRGELQSLDLLEAQEEAAALTAELQRAHPDLTLPDDVAARIGAANAEAG